jgi:hypothetical protein
VHWHNAEEVGPTAIASAAAGSKDTVSGCLRSVKLTLTGRIAQNSRSSFDHAIAAL